MIDALAMGFIAVLAVFGIFRGLVSQLASVLGFIACYFYSSQISDVLNPKMKIWLGSDSQFSKPFSALIACFLIFLGFRLAGYLFEKTFINRLGFLKGGNHFLGGLLGACKGIIILFVVFYLLQLVPLKVLEKMAPNLTQSQVYQFFTTHNPMPQKYLESFKINASNPIQKTIEHPL